MIRIRKRTNLLDWGYWKTCRLEVLEVELDWKQQVERKVRKLVTG